jgi:hypothetical protein
MRLWVGAEAGLALTVGFLVACGTASTQEEQALSTTPTPRLILTPPSFSGVPPQPVPATGALVFEGSTDAYTPLFSTSTPAWRIKWSVQSLAPEFLLFAAAVFSRGDQRTPVTAFEDMGKLQGEVDVTAPEGEYYIRVFTANVQRWKLEIQR